MAIRFFRMNASKRLVGIGALDGSTLYRWVPSFGCWVKSAELLTDLVFARDMDQMFRWTEIQREETLSLMWTVPRLDRAKSPEAWDLFSSESDRRSSSDLGLEMVARRGQSEIEINERKTALARESIRIVLDGPNQAKPIPIHHQGDGDPSRSEWDKANFTVEYGAPEILIVGAKTDRDRVLIGAYSDSPQRGLEVTCAWPDGSSTTHNVDIGYPGQLFDLHELPKTDQKPSRVEVRIHPVPLPSGR